MAPTTINHQGSAGKQGFGDADLTDEEWHPLQGPWAVQPCYWSFTEQSHTRNKKHNSTLTSCMETFGPEPRINELKVINIYFDIKTTGKNIKNLWSYWQISAHQHFTPAAGT